MGITEEILLLITGDSKSAQQALQGLQSRLDPLKQKIDEVGRAGKQLAFTFGALSAAGGALIKSTAQVAMRNEVLAVGLYTVGQQAGYSRIELDSLVDGVKAMGITTSNARLSLVRMIQAELDLSKATDMARTSQDLAGIAGQNSSEAYSTIMEAVSALQPRLLRQYGIVATTNQILGDLADSTDTAAKRQRFFDYILEEGTKVAGTYKNMMGVVGKQITSIPRYVEEAKAALGKHFIPIIGKGVAVLSTLLKWFEALPEPVQKFIAQLILLGTAGAAIIAAFGGLLAILPAIISGFGVVSGALGTIAAIAAPLIAIIGGLIAVGAALASAWKQDWGGLRSTIENTYATVKPYIDQLITLIRLWGMRFVGRIKEVGSALWGLVRGILEPLFTRATQILKSIDWSSAFTTLLDTLNAVAGFIDAWLKAIAGLLRGEGASAFEPLQDAAVNVLTAIALLWQKYISKAAAWGWNLIVQIANGISKAAQSVLTSVMRTIGNIIGMFLAPGSPPKKGPLSRIVEWGKGVMNTYIKSFALADFSLFRDALEPFKTALESALSAGDISQDQFGELFQSVRSQVAALIASFRKTGEISEEALGRIAETLGEGSEELVKYLRLQLEHQKALENLKSVQEEVAEAEEKGFVSAELKEKLKSAENAADAAKEEVEWQKEYLALQQEGVDLQAKLASTMGRLADSIDKLAGGADEALSGTGTGGLAEALGAGDLGGITDGLASVKDTIAGMSPEFAAMKKRVEEWITKVQTFLTLPFDEKLRLIAQYLQDSTGIDFPGFLQKIFTVAEQIDEKGLLGAIQSWIDKGLAYIDDNWKDWAESIKDFLGAAFQEAVKLLLKEIEDAKQSVIDWFHGIITRFLLWVESKREEWAQNLKDHIHRMMTHLMNMLSAGAPEWISKFVAWFKNIITNFVNKVRDRISGWVDGLKKVGTKIVDKIKEGLTNAWDMVSYLGNLFSTLATNLIEGGWLAKVADVGAAIVERIKEGIAGAWDAFIAWLVRRIQGIADLLPWSEPKDPQSPLRGLSKSGKAMVENFASGITLSPVRSALVRELGRTQGALARSVGATTIYQNIEGGLNFPNVTSGRDAAGVRREIDTQALRAGMMARTGAV